MFPAECALVTQFLPTQVNNDVYLTSSSIQVSLCAAAGDDHPLHKLLHIGVTACGISGSSLSFVSRHHYDPRCQCDQSQQATGMSYLPVRRVVSSHSPYTRFVQDVRLRRSNGVAATGTSSQHRPEALVESGRKSFAKPHAGACTRTVQQLVFRRIVGYVRVLFNSLGFVGGTRDDLVADAAV